MQGVEPKRTFATLDAIRGIAAVCVMGFHYALLDQTFPIKFSNAFIDVDLFFCLSGFVLMQAYGDWTLRSRGVVKFLKIRMVRLYPMYITGTVIGIVAYAASLRSGSGLDTNRITVEVMTALFMLPDLNSVVDVPFSIKNAIYPFNVPAWSLLFEILANVALVARRWDRASLLTLAGVAGVALASVAFATRTLNGGFEATTMLIGLLRATYNFTVGALLMKLYEKGILNDLSLPPIVSILGVIALSVMLPPHARFDVIVVLFVVPLVVTVATRDPRSRWGLMACAWLGRISYPLYAIHYPLVLLAMQYQSQHLSKGWLIGTCAIVAVGLSDVLARTLDPMLRHVLSRALFRRTKLASA